MSSLLAQLGRPIIDAMITLLSRPLNAFVHREAIIQMLATTAKFNDLRPAVERWRICKI
jgi:hypothetical protein